MTETTKEQSIWNRRHQIDKEFRDEQRRLLEDYKKNVYHPAVKKLVTDCAAPRRGKFHDNGWGHTWYYCSQCGTAFDKKSYHLDFPDGEDDE